MIEGGYILQPRSIEDSKVSSFPPHVREIWLYLLRKANYKDCRTNGRLIKRGQLLTSYEKIIDDLSWHVGYRKESYKKHHCGISMKLLTKEQMIATMKTTRGMIVTILNYELYQNPDNYENNNDSDNEKTMKKQSSHTISKESKESKEINTISSERSEDHSRTGSDKLKISFNWDSESFENISQSQNDIWAKTYPAVNIPAETLKAAAWQAANPKKRKKDYKKFLNSWFARQQERGGSKNYEQQEETGERYYGI